jgi:hypothetical protein
MEEIDPDTIVGDLNTPLLSMDRTTRKKLTNFS